jgi:hypothetical protein
MPVALYPVYLQTGTDPSVGAYWQHWRSLPFCPNGPTWFFFSLLVLTFSAGVLRVVMPGYGERLGRLAAGAGAHPARFFLGLVTASALAYVPLAIAFTPWEWLQFGPFSFQLSRPLHNAVYFFAGVGVGAYGIERGLLDPNGALARHWARWLAATPVATGRATDRSGAADRTAGRRRLAKPGARPPGWNRSDQSWLLMRPP